eukprot:jgi/Galph1/508/GphlegSOOS_G5205.1
MWQKRFQLPLEWMFQIWGANTGVGKTVIATGITANFLNKGSSCLYLKPVQTGYPPDDDASFVRDHCSKLANLANNPAEINLIAKKLFVFKNPLGAEQAAQLEGRWVYNDQVLNSLYENLCEFRKKRTFKATSKSVSILETAGGVLSPLPSGTSQADGYRCFRFPAILVGDGTLGGISTTLTAYESLMSRGYDVPIIAAIDLGYGNIEAWKKVVSQEETTIISFPTLPSASHPLFDWYQEKLVQEGFVQLVSHLEQYQLKRTERLEEMKENALQVFWWPFTQHGSSMNPILLDSAYEDYYHVVERNAAATQVSSDKHQSTSNWHSFYAFDGVASWWTQGVGHSNITLNKAMMKAAGRYGHVIFPQIIHQPAYELSKKLIETVGLPWAKRVYYSDDGSTAIELAIKMALRLYQYRCGTVGTNDSPVVLSFHGSYHGDTLGAMDCSPKGDYNELQTPCNGKWVLDIAQNDALMKHLAIKSIHWNDWSEIEEIGRDQSEIGKAYENYVQSVLDTSSLPIAALIIEPVIQGAGGMRLIDPCFQRVVIRACKKKGIPVVYDEVFAGIWRLGVLSSTSTLKEDPDIAAYAKLLTGGLLPMAATLTTEEVFEAFKADKKKFALLHGHSYTAYPVGCQVALKSLELFEKSPNLSDKDKKQMNEFWNMNKVKQLSQLNGVKIVSCLGTVLAVELESSQNARGYHALITQSLLDRLLQDGIYTRPLGNVLYILCSPFTKKEVCDELIEILMSALSLTSEGLVRLQDDIAVP